MLGHELEGGVAVIVETAHEPGAQLISDAEMIEPTTHLGEEVSAIVVQVLIEARHAGGNAPIGVVLGIEDAEWVHVKAPATVLGKLRRVLAEIADERLAVSAPARGVSECVELQDGSIEDTEVAQDLRAQLDHLHVRLRLRHADELHVDLMKLAEPALLRPLVPEHRSAREELERQALRQSVGDDRAADAGGIFGPERDLIAAAVAESVHFLGHDIRGLADRPREPLAAL